MDAAPGDVFLEVFLDRLREAALELLAALGVPGHEARRPDAVQRVDVDLVLSEPRGEIDRAIAPRDRAVDVLGVHADLREARVRHRQLAARRHAVEDLDRHPRGVGGLGRPPRAPQRVGEQIQVGRLRAHVADSLAQLDRAV